MLARVNRESGIANRESRIANPVFAALGYDRFAIRHQRFAVFTMTTVKRRVMRAGGWGIAKRIIKPIPIVGSVFAFGLAGYEIKKKGLLPGVVHVGLDVTPFIGTAKGVLEIFTGDLIPDKKDRRKKAITPKTK
jgi:hypothetical protein